VPIFIVNYDYGTGSTHLGVVAESAEEVVARLQHVKIVDPDVVGPTADHVRKLKAIARPIDDPLWDNARRRS
jgi:hypothetical protein